jgi:hypothetical protein
MKDITRIGMDTSKSVFQLHRVNGAEDVVRPGFRRYWIHTSLAT